MNNLHGHEMISLIIEQEKALSIEEIKELAIKELGANASYFTCSASNMDTDEMIGFLMDSQKLIKVEDGYVINTGNLCDH